MVHLSNSSIVVIAIMVLTFKIMTTITIKKEIQSKTHWWSKEESVILTDKEENIDIIHQWLIAQDDYWESYRHIIKVFDFNSTIKSEKDLIEYCDYCGKTDIDNVQDLINYCNNKGIKIFLWQYKEKMETTYIY